MPAWGEVEDKILEIDGTRVVFTHHPKWNHWQIHFEHGATPKALTGMFTDWNDALERTKRYMETRVTRDKEYVREYSKKRKHAEINSDNSPEQSI